MIEYLFLDLDDTILDFHAAERAALEKTFRELNIRVPPETAERYKQINILHWKMLERGEITREQMKVGRFAVLFRELGIDRAAEPVTAIYEKYLAEGHYFLPGAEGAVEALSKKYRLFLASNGTAAVQAGRLTSADLYRFFEQVFVSEELGYNKPDRAYFAAAFARIDGFEPAKAMIVGDSLTSDILGGINAGIRTCWVNPGHLPGDPRVHADHEIENLTQLEALLDHIQEGHP